MHFKLSFIFPSMIFYLSFFHNFGVVSAHSFDLVYFRLFCSSGSCAVCGQGIPANEMVMRTQGNVYHLKCFNCYTCNMPLSPGDRFGVVNGNIICENDYSKTNVKGQVNGNSRNHKYRGIIQST